MDDATIKAMRAVIGCLEKRAAVAQRGNHEYVSIGHSDIPAAAFSLAHEGFRELVDKAAAEQSMEPSRHPVADALLKAMSYAPHDRFVEVGRCSQFGDHTVIGQFTKGEVACFLESIKQPLASERDAEPVATSEDQMLERFTEDLEDAVIAARKDDETHVSIMTTRCQRTWSLEDVYAVIRAINGLLNAKQETPATAAEPTLEECVAAMNGAEFLRGSDWCLAVRSLKVGLIITVADARLTADWLIDRERAAKGGA